MRVFVILVLIISIGIAYISCNSDKENQSISSPSKMNEVLFFIKEGKPSYTVKHKDNVVIDTSYLGFFLKDSIYLTDEFEITESESKTINETWEMPWGEQRTVVNDCNELTVKLTQKHSPNYKLNIVFRAYDDGIAFRYEFPEQDALKEAIILDEKTQFQLTEDLTCWWIPGDWDIYEHLYNTSRFSEINALEKGDKNLAQSYIPHNAVNTPFTMLTNKGLHLSFHEANLTDYAGMTLLIDNSNLSMESKLVASKRKGYSVKRELPFKTPWRTIQISDDAAGLIESKLIVNLNEPNKIGDASWIKPMKYVGIWWEMHLNKSYWDLASGKHGATTENAKAYIDFASKNNIGGVLIEGWNTGWERWIGFEDREGIFDFVTPYEDYDMNEVVNYAKEKGVEIIMHHETSAAPQTYEKQLDTAFKMMKHYGMNAVKTGYVGPIIPKGEYHHGQWMVNHYRKVLETAAEYKIAVNAHEPIKATGLRRTYPNAIAREGLRGQEFNAWSQDGGNPPEHISIVAFTRMLAGPIDFTPGVFNIKLKPYKENNQVNTTLAHQLALYVVIYSPIQMACDLIEHYENQPAFQFIRDVGVDWEQTKVLNGEVGEYITIAREERNTGNWFIGGITDENPREITIDFSFLKEGTKYKALIYKDGGDAHWNDNPLSIEITEDTIDSHKKSTYKLAAGGGLAISLLKI